MKLEHGLINLKILFSKAQKLSDYIIFKSKLFHSITVDEKKKKEFLKKLYLALKWGMLLVVLLIYPLPTLGSILKRFCRD